MDAAEEGVRCELVGGPRDGERLVTERAQQEIVFEERRRSDDPFPRPEGGRSVAERLKDGERVPLDEVLREADAVVHRYVFVDRRAGWRRYAYQYPESGS